MVTKNFPQYITLILAISIMSACSSNKSPYSKSYTGSSGKSKNSLPKVPARIVPGGSGDNWRYLGVTGNSALAIEINESSINKQSGNIYKYQDRKTVVNPANFAYNGTPNYYYSLSWWKINCDTKQYLTLETALYDGYGKSIKNYSFSNNSFANVASGSVAETQYNYVCNNVYRNVGY